MIKHKAAAVAVTAIVLGLLPFALPHASAGPPIPGMYMAYGTLSAIGWQTSPVTSTPDPAQWQTWPSRSWYLETWPLYATGTVNGWCDESKGQGTPSSYLSGYEGHYYGGLWGIYAGLRSIRWTGVGRTLAFTADMDGWFGYNTPVFSDAPFHGTLIGTVTLLTDGMTLFDLCTNPDGLQQPIPVLLAWTYVLQ